MKTMLPKTLFSLPGLAVVGALVLGLGLGRYLVPSPEIRLESEMVGRRTDGGTAHGVTPGAFRQSPKNAPSAREVTRRPEGTAEEQRAALATILNEGYPLQRTRDMLSFIDSLDNQGIAEVVKTFREAGWVDFNRGEYSLLISAWMTRDPYQALSDLDQNDPDGWTRKTAISAWASEDPEAAYTAVQGLEDEGLVNDWLVGLVEGTARNDPEGALAIMQEISSKETNLEALREIVPEVVIRGPQFAGEWMQLITDPRLKKEAATRIASTMGRRDPEAASLWAESLDSPELRREASGVIAEVYAREDLDGAKTWVQSLPGDSIGPAASNVARLLTRKDPSEAASWLRQLGNDPSLDEARIRFLQEAGKQDPETALENVATLSRAQDQERYYRDLLSRWRKDDQQAAVTWATSHSEILPPKVLRSILPKQK